MSVPAEMLIALNTVAGACAVARAVQQDLARVREITKDDRSPVTVADFAVQAIVSLALREQDAHVLIVGEERADELRTDENAAVRDEVVRAVQTVRANATADEVLDAIDHGDHDGSGARYWALDPVDGTKGFLRGQQYAIALGCIEHGHVVAGVMGCPNLPADHEADLTRADAHGLMYFALRDQGAFQIPSGNPSAPPEPVHARTEIPATGIQTCESVEKAHSKHDDTARILAHLGGGGVPVRLDSQCKYAVVARGQADAYLRLPTRKDYVEKIWDHAAGSIIATEAGAVVTDVAGNPLDFTHGRRLEQNRGIICAAPAIHGKIIDAIDQLDLAGDASS